MLAIDADVDAVAADRDVAFVQFLAGLGDLLFDRAADHALGFTGLGGGGIGDRFVPAAGAGQGQGGQHGNEGGRSDHVHGASWRSEEHTSELQSLMRISYAVFCLKKKKKA